jgi:hypothetical protein
MRPTATLLLVASVLIAAPGRAGAQGEALERGRQAYLEAEFDQASAAFEEVVRSADASRAALAEALRTLAVLSLIRGDRPAAERHALQALTLEPAVGPPEGASPGALALFETARGGLRGALDATLAIDPRGRARVTVQGDAGGLAALARVDCGGAPVEVALDRTGSGELRLARGALRAGRCTASVRTAAGAELVTTHATLERRAERSRPRAMRRARSSSPWPWIALATAATAATAAIVTGLIVATTPDGANLGPTEIAE